MPKWVAKGISHEETIGTERSKKYPLLVCSNHPRWSVHSQHEDITWLREIETCKVKGPDGYQYHPVWLNPAEAERHGIKHGDIVSIINDRGTVLGGAYIFHLLGIVFGQSPSNLYFGAASFWAATENASAREASKASAAR